jgi:hypothetical protein
MMNSASVSTRPAWVVLLAWAALMVLLNARGAFVTDARQPPLPLLAAVAVPPILFGLAYAASGTVRAIAMALDLRLLTAMQAWRLIGAMFLVLMWFGMLPGTFAWPAGVGDAIVGAYAPFVLVAMVRRTQGWQKHVLLLNVLGLIDFVGAIGGGVLSGNSPIAIFHASVSTDIMQSLPLSLIPTFGVPFWIVLHIVSLLQLRKDAVPVSMLQPT